MENVLSVLSKNDAVCLLEIIHASLSCTREEEFKELVGKLNRLISFDFAVSGLARIDVNWAIKSYEVVNISYPHEWLEIYLSRKFYLIDPVFKNNFTNFGLQYWPDTYKTSAPPAEYLSLAVNYGLRDGYTYGVKNKKGTEGSLFSINCKSSVSRKSRAFHRRVAVILTHIAPHLHQTLYRIFVPSNKKHMKPLSSREIEILNWIKEGKSSWDTSKILGISESTVNFHITNVMQKLDAVSRPQAVANAVLYGLIDID